MGAVNNLNQGDVAEIWRAIRQLQVATPLNSASIGSGGMRVYDGGVITIENGGLSVTGSGTFVGTLNANGTITFTGTLTQSGPSTFTGDTKLNGPTHINGATDITGNTTVTGDFKVTGPTHLEGATDIKGALSVEGATTLKGDMTLTTGKIKAGGMTIDPSVSGGSLVFSGGGGVQGGGGPTVMKGAGNAGFISDTTASVFAGANSVDVSPSAVTINGPLKAPGITSTSNAANVYFDPSTKQLYYKP
jgi:hypothetical protein